MSKRSANRSDRSQSDRRSDSSPPRFSGALVALCAVLALLLPGAAGPTAAQAPPTYALVHAETVGETDVPWFRSAAQLNGPSGIDADGDAVWIADGRGKRLLSFASAGRFLDEVGRAGLSHSIHGEPVRRLADVAVAYAPRVPAPTPDPDPDAEPDPGVQWLWMVDAEAHYVLGLAREIGRSVVLGVADEAGDSDDRLRAPTGVAVSADGTTVLVSDTGNHRIQVFRLDSDFVGGGLARGGGVPGGTSGATLLATIGETGVPGADDAHLDAPARLAFGRDGRLYVADAGNHRVLAYDVADAAAPRRDQAYGGARGSGRAELDTPTGVVADAQFVYVADSANCRVVLLRKRDGDPWDTIGSPDGCQGDDLFRRPTDVDLDERAFVYVADPGRSQVTVFDPFERTTRLRFGTNDIPYVTDDAHHNAPAGVAFAPPAAPNEPAPLLLVERDGHRLVRREGDGSIAWTFGVPGVPGDDETHLAFPGDVALAPDGRAIVADTGNDRLVRVDGAGAFAGTIGGPGSGAGRFDGPTGLGVAADGRIAVADRGNHRVQILAADGSRVATLGETGVPGDDDTHFDGPTDAAFDGAGRIVVADRGNHRVLVLKTGGALVRQLGETGVPGEDFAHFDRPSRVAVDGDGRIYVADTGNHRIQVFAADGTYLHTVGGSRGTGSGGLLEPLGVAVAEDGALAVADSGHHRVQRFRLPTAPWLPEATNGLGRRSTRAISAVAEHQGALWAGIWDADRGASLWRRPAGGVWDEIATDGLGDVEDVGVTALATFDGRLYAGLLNQREERDPVTGVVTRTTRGGAIWAAGGGAAPSIVADDGFGEAGNAAVMALEVFDGQLYAGTAGFEIDDTGQIWRSASGAAGSWSRVADAGALGADGQRGIVAMAVMSDTLYAGTCSSTLPGQLWRSANGRSWQAVGAPGNSRVRGDCVSALEPFGDHLYVAVGSEARLGTPRRAGLLWRCALCDGSDWEQAGPSGMGIGANRGRVALQAFDAPPFSFLYWAAGNDDGVQLWRATDGLRWEQAGVGGFGDDNNRDLVSADALAVFERRLYAATWNDAHGGELWSTAGSRPAGGGGGPSGPRPTATPRPRVDPPTGKARYELVGQWPPGRVIPRDAIGQVGDMIVADDGTVYLADTSNNRVMRLALDGSWGEAFGNIGRGPDRIGQIGAIEVDETNGRLYVADLASERLLVFDREGQLLDVWRESYVTGMHALPDGRLWIADRLAGGVRLLAADGTEQQRFGSFGDREADQFLTLVDVTVDPDGNLFVSDLDGARIRGFRPEGPTFRRFRLLDLTLPKFQGCDGTRIEALDVEVLHAEGCRIDGADRDNVYPTNHRGSDLYGAFLRTANPRAPHYVALALYDSDRFDPENETWPVVVRYAREGFDVVARWHRAARLDTAGGRASGVINAPVRLSTAPDGTLMVTDDFGLRQRGADGTVLEDLPLIPYPSRTNPLTMDPLLSVGEGRDGHVMGVGTYGFGRFGRPVVVYGKTEVRRYCRNRRCEVNPYLDVIWDTSMPDLTEGVQAVAHEASKGQFVVLNRYHTAPSGRGIEAISSRLLVYGLGFQGRKEEFVLPGEDREAIWADVDAGFGRIAVLDTLNDRIQLLDAELNDLGMVSTPKDAWRVAAGPNGELYVLTVYGHVVRLAADGTVLSRFVSRPHEGVPPTSLVDLAVDGDGWVYTVDELANQVTVFAPAGTTDEVLQGATCNLEGDKYVDPNDILLGNEAELWLTLFGTCGFVEQPADIVLAVNTYGFTLGTDRGRVLANNLRRARQIAALTDLDRHRMAVVSFSINSAVETELTDSSFELVKALRSAGADRGQPSELYTALQASFERFDARSADRKRVIVIVDPQGDTDERAIARAEELKAQDFWILVVNGSSVVASGDLFDDIDVDPRAIGAGKPVHRRLVTRIQPDLLVKSGTLVDELPANIDYVPGSAVPPATWDAAARTLTWDLRDLLLVQVHRFGFRIRPTEEGEWPTNVRARATVVDGWDQPQTVDYPIPRIRVYGELPPTPTATPTVTPTPEPTSTPLPPKPLYLPILLRTGECKPESRNADVALLIDTSGSMSQTTSPGGPTKLVAARDAARDFLGQLVAGRDQAAVIQFNNKADALVDLTDDPAVAIAALDRLGQATGTRIDLALGAGLDVLTGPNRRAANNPVLILLTDGEPSGTTPEAVRAAAERAKAADLLVFTIGLGQDVDPDLLRDVAGRPEWYFAAPDTADLAEIYGRIAFEIPCEPEWP